MADSWDAKFTGGSSSGGLSTGGDLLSPLESDTCSCPGAKTDGTDFTGAGDAELEAKPSAWRRDLWLIQQADSSQQMVNRGLQCSHKNRTTVRCTSVVDFGLAITRSVVANSYPGHNLLDDSCSHDHSHCPSRRKSTMQTANGLQIGLRLRLRAQDVCSMLLGSELATICTGILWRFGTSC